MNDITPFLPTGPNFGQLAVLGGPIAFIMGILLGIATLLAFIGVFVNLVKLAAAAMSGNAIKLRIAGKGLGITGSIFVVLLVFWGILVTLVTNIGTGIAGG